MPEQKALEQFLDISHLLRGVISDIRFLIKGKKLKFKEGTNATMGTVALVAGTVTVPTTAVTSNSRILITHQPGGTNHGFLRISTITPDVSFIITSSNASDTGTIFWFIIDKI